MLTILVLDIFLPMSGWSSYMSSSSRFLQVWIIFVGQSILSANAKLPNCLNFFRANN